MRAIPTVTLFITAITLLLSFSISGQPQKSYSSSEIRLLLDKINTAGTVLYVAAHPDDENTRLLSYLANERTVRTAYVSLTRGDGGQNLIGTDIGPYLGLIRSFELMAARKVDRAEQFFTRAYDFGYSKNPEETFNIWDREKVLDDLVYIIRYFKPDLIITRFAPDGSGGHGHHTASAILAEEAFEAASDSKRFTHQLKNVDVWQAHALLYNNAGRFRNPNADMSGNLEVNVGAYNPLLGKSYGEIAGLSRSMHKSQGFGSRNYKGDILEYFLPVKGYAPKEDLFEGLDISLNRLKGGQTFSESIQMAVDNFDISNPENIVTHLLKAYQSLNQIEDNYWKEQKQKELVDLIMACSGIWIEMNAMSPTATPGESVELQVYGINRSKIHTSILSTKILKTTISTDTIALNVNKPQEIKYKYALQQDQEFTGPYWLRNMPKDGLFNLNSQSQLNQPVDSGHLFAEVKLDIMGTEVIINRPVTYRWVDPVQGEQFRLFEITPEVMVNFADEVIVFADDLPKKCKIILKAGKDQVDGSVSLEATSDIIIEPAEAKFSINKKDEEISVEFLIYPGDHNGLSDLRAKVKLGDKTLDRSLIKLNYDHIPIQMVFPEAVIKLVNLDLNITPQSRIGYITGAGDDVANGLRQVGYIVDEMSEDQLAKANLNQYKAILTGVRAFNTNERLFAQINKLNEYVENGGVLIVQYVTNSWAGPLKGPIGPYDFTISRDRVTDETAPVQFLLPNHKVLNTPNKISQADFDHWIQERGLYFAKEMDEKFETPLGMSDPGEPLHNGSLIIAPYGKGHYVYTGLSFFRQIPNGTPGAYRLLTNLVELNHIQP